MILFKGCRMKPEWLDNLPASNITSMTPRDNMTSEVFVDWLDHLITYKSKGNCLLIFEVLCHLDYRIVEATEKHKITLYCIPSQTTHELQPMDKSVFGPFESYWDQEVLIFMRQNPGKSVGMQRFGAIFSSVCDKAATPANIKAGFRGTGIYPFKPNVISDHSYAPKWICQRSQHMKCHQSQYHHRQEKQQHHHQMLKLPQDNNSVSPVSSENS